MKLLTFSPNAIAARQEAYRARKESLNTDLQNISELIKDKIRTGNNWVVYQIAHKENMRFIIEILRDQGYKVKRNWLFHSAQNEIEVNW